MAHKAGRRRDQGWEAKAESRNLESANGEKRAASGRPGFLLSVFPFLLLPSKHSILSRPDVRPIQVNPSQSKSIQLKKESF